jgi:hypothetical protein
MRVLYVVFVVSLLVLVFTIVALRRHIRKHDAEAGGPPRPPSGTNEDPLKDLE